MTHFKYYDIVFIVIFAGAFSVITYLGYEKLLSRFGLVISLMAYYFGKYA